MLKIEMRGQSAASMNASTTSNLRDNNLHPPRQLSRLHTLYKMLSTARSRFPALRRCLQLTPITPTRRYADGYPIPANDPNPKTPVQNVSATNALPTSSEGSFDKVLQESVQVAEERRTMQAPNRKGIWSRSQRPRSQAMTGPRFEQTIMEDQ
ncbi:hypothetical protein LTR16_008038, partial [Cryomyces antarcticus]